MGRVTGECHPTADETVGPVLNDCGGEHERALERDLECLTPW
jgi:hypothetical protein